MARIPRKYVVDEDTVGIYHCINRCVRRAWLCGQDPYTGQNFDHRKHWVRDRLEFLAAHFAIDICSYAVLSGHLHVILRNRPDIVRTWSDEEVARRWWNLFPARRDEKGRPAELEPHELQMLLADRKALKERRRRLSSLSWFMRCLCEPIARRANQEDGCTGRFFQGRFKCQPLLDEAALLACSIYVDLNPIRAGLAKTPETSLFTSVYDRIWAGRKRRGRKDRKRGQHGAEQDVRDYWLSPIELEPRGRPRSDSPAKRASHKGFLPLTLEQYLQLVDWTGRQAQRDKRGRIPDELEPILVRLQICSESWVDLVLNFGRWFRRAAGRTASLEAEARRRRRRWLQGIRHSRVAFV